MDTCAEAINQNTKTIRVMRDTQEEDVQRRIDLMKATQDAAIYAELTARQSRYLAGVATTIRDRSGVEISTHDILMGLINGIENSDFNLTHYGTRQEIAEVIETVMQQSIHAMRSQLDE